MTIPPAKPPRVDHGCRCDGCGKRDTLYLHAGLALCVNCIYKNKKDTP
jgi:hypothetical protein